jgi:hypothetical protein
MKLRDNETLLLKLNLKLEIAQKKVEEIQTQIDNVNRDILDPAIICCGKKYISNQDLKNHNNTKSCSNKFEPVIKCKICRNTFYGLTKGETETLSIGNMKFDLSSYGKHYKKCFSCLDCGIIFKSFDDKKLHLKYKPCNINNINSTITDSSSDEEEIIKCEIPILDEEDLERPESNISSSSEIETEDWKYQNFYYEVDKHNNVYDKYGNEIGIRALDEWDNYKLYFN